VKLADGGKEFEEAGEALAGKLAEFVKLADGAGAFEAVNSSETSKDSE
jgi:hypothetical protein